MIGISASVLKVVIVEDNTELAQVIAHFLGGLERYEIVGIARDGERGLALIRSHPVDVAIIDLVLPGKDGLYVLEELSRRPEEKPVCIVLSGVSLEAITKKAFEKGADYFILKPFDLDLLARRIDETWEQKKNREPLDVNRPVPRVNKPGPEDFVLGILHDIPVPNTLNGYTYLKTALLLAISDVSMLEGVTKCLYPAVAKRHGTTGPQVERAMRHAVEMAWQKGGGRNFVRIVGYGDPSSPKPTNTAFITAVVELYHQLYG